MSRVKVTYSRRKADEKDIYVLTDHSDTFKSFEEAIEHIKKIRTMKDIIGSPLVESI